MNENQNEYVDINAHDNYPDSEQTIEIPTMKVIPLKKICMTIGELPTSYLETMTYYEMLIWFIEYLKNNIIPTINNNASAIQEVQSVVLALQEYINDYKDSIDSDVEELEEYMNNYFENLDVQEEINNKLDDMLEDGVLEQIIEQFLQLTSLICFDNVADMKLSPNLANGSYARTLGYYSKNDGGGAIYKIRAITNEDIINNGSIIPLLNETLIAELNEKNIYPEMFGAYGDGTHDDTTAFENAINKTGELNLYEKTYKLTSLTISKDLIINGNNATLIDNTDENHFIEMLSSSNNKNLWLHHINIDTPHCDVGIYINGNKLNGDNIIIKNAKEINIHIVKTGAFGACNIDTIRCQLAPIGIQLDATDCHISHFIGFNCMKHLVNNGGLTHINSFHGWNYNDENTDWITGSTLIDTTDSLIGNDVYIDTLENGIVLPNAHPYTSVILQNVSYFLNRSSYPATQQAPTLLKNVENFTGYCRIDGFYGDENGWVDSNNNFPTLIDNIDPSRITLTNVTNSGFRFGKYKPIETYEDISTSSYTKTIDTYITFNTRKIKYNDYELHAYLEGSFKTSCPANTIMVQYTLTGQNLQYLNSKTRVTAKFISTSTPGLVRTLGATIDNNHVLSIYNDSGVTLGEQGNYGGVYVYIDDIHQTK